MQKNPLPAQDMLTRRLMLAGAACALTGCARRGAPGRIAASNIAPAVLPPRFGDADPVAWPGRGPDAYPVHGIDLSRFQGMVDWQAARAGGVTFAFVKATEGGDLLDPMLAANLSGARAAGVMVGAYHFFYFCTPAEVQADWFIANVPRLAGDLPPVLDLEWNAFSPTCRLRPAPEIVRGMAARFRDRIARAYGRQPIIYTTPDFWEENDIARLGGEFWLRAVTRHPGEAYPGARWTFWQYSGTGRVPGIAGNVDLNAFAGSPAAWARWLARHRIA